MTHSLVDADGGCQCAAVILSRRTARRRRCEQLFSIQKRLSRAVTARSVGGLRALRRSAHSTCAFAHGARLATRLLKSSAFSGC